MRGAVNVGAIFGRLRREVLSGVVDNDSTTGVQTITPLDAFFSKHRSCKSHIPFSTLDVSFRKYFYGRAAKHNSENVGDAVTYIACADQVEPYVRHFG
jgi:hypothetical protein